MAVTHALQVLDRWHFAMLNDGVRNRKYQLAITAAVTRALEAHGRCTVLDIGTGSGILAMSVTSEQNNGCMSVTYGLYDS